MDRFQVYWTAALICWLTTIATARGDEPASDPAHTISGIVMEIRSGTPNVPVFLCDGTTGVSLEKGTYKLMGRSADDPYDLRKEMAIAVSDKIGKFHFENVPEGTYRLVAQKWMEPFRGLFEVYGTVIQLMGTANNVVVPRPTDNDETPIVLRPPGQAIVQFDQDVGNDETFMFLSTSPTEFDPILGPYAMGSAFLRNLVGVNRMPSGRTTVINVPDQPMYAFFIAADNRPGFATLNVPAPRSGFVRMPAQSFVAAWSNGRKTPPPKLAQLMEFLDAHSLTVSELLDIPRLSNATFAAHQARVQELMEELSRTITLPEGTSARVGDLLAVDRYRQLMAAGADSNY